MRIIIINLTTAEIDPMTAHRWLGPLLALTSLVAIGSAYGQDAEARLVIRNHRFEPVELTVPAGKKLKLVIENQDDTAEEFESYELNREKVVPPKGTISVYVGPLEPGRYPFFGDFHKDSAQGVLIAK
jgi:cupredoxin-like protein